MAYLQKAITKLKSDGGITIRFPSVEWAGSEMAIGVHCDSGGILTRVGSKAHIAICGFPKRKGE